MATKINTAFYGAENTFVDVYTGVKCCAKTIGQLARDGTYTGGSFDLTAAPWGVGKSSVSSDFIFLPLRTDSPTWDIYAFKNEKTNTPLYFYRAQDAIPGGNDPSNLDVLSIDLSYCRGMFKMRMSPNVSVDSSFNAKSTLTIDNNTTISTGTAAQRQQPITYLDYRNIRLCIDDIYYKPTGAKTILKCSMADILNHAVSVDKIVRVQWTTRLVDVGTSTTIQLSIGGGELNIPDLFRSVYYGDKLAWVRPWHRISGVGYWYQTGGAVSFSADNSSRITPVSRYSSQTAQNDIVSSGNCGYGHLSDKLQIFDDVSYHWEYGVSPAGANEWDLAPYKNGDNFTYETQIRLFAYMELDGEYDDKNLAYYRAILHEAAFIGFPVITGAGDLDKSIGDNEVFLPIFDEYLITTGDFKSGSDALSLPNATWRDVFSTTMPDYDPSIQPEPPTPSDENDRGDLNNKLTSYDHRYANPNSVYAMTQSNFMKFVNDINGLYLSDPDDTQLKIDFKGSNPNDYVIGVYGIPFLCNYIVPSGPDVAVDVGPVTLPTAEGKLVDTSTSILRDCGSITVPALGDFRDYEPYSQYELYIPMCGTIQLDGAQVAGRTLHIEVYYDIMTMDCTAAVYRDATGGGETLIATVNGTLGASLPLTAARMGDYQNSIKTTQNALKQNEMRTAFGVGGAVIGVAGAALAPETGGLSLALAGAAIAGVSTAASGALTEKQLQYDLTHKQPSVSQCSAANGATAQLISTFYPHLFIKRAKMIDTYDAEIYTKTVGHATLRAAQLSSFSGLTVAAAAELSNIYTIDGAKAATEQELKLIKQALLVGVYV